MNAGPKRPEYEPTDEWTALGYFIEEAGETLDRSPPSDRAEDPGRGGRFVTVRCRGIRERGLVWRC